MIKVEWTEPNTDTWAKWKRACSTQRSKAIKSLQDNGTCLPTKKLYSKEKASIAAMYHGKCGWCEKRITMNQFGDLDHFRPKRGIAEEDWSAIQYVRDGRTGDHPGYYWLEYEATNLVFCCELCNRVGPRREWGKGTRFPVEEFRAELPDEETQENPKILHPSIDEPKEHIAVDETGILTVIGGSEKGRATIEILGLNKRDLPVERARVFEDTLMKIDRIWFTSPNYS